MKAIWIIAVNTYREIIRDRILYGIVVFALLLIGVSLALGQLSFAEQARISANFGFTAIQLGASILAIFVGSSLVAKEIEKQTILTVLVRPITRTRFLIGKFLGLMLVVSTVMMGLAMVLAAVLLYLGLDLSQSFLIALFGIHMESVLLIAVALFFGSFSRPVMTVIFSGSFFLIGHWVADLDFFVEKSSSPTFKAVGDFVRTVMLDLNKFNWRSAPIYDVTVPLGDVLSAAVYALGWLILLFAGTSLIFGRRDFV